MDRTARTWQCRDAPPARCRTITRSGGPHVRLTVEGAADLPRQRPLFLSEQILAERASTFDNAPALRRRGIRALMRKIFYPQLH